MSKKLYYSLLLTFAIIFMIGMTLLFNQNSDYDLELWSYYAGGQNTAVEDFNKNSDYNMKFTGIAADNFTTKVDTAMASGQLPDIIMIDSNDLGRYVENDNFIDFNQLFNNSDGYDQYKQAASEYGLNLGQYEGMQKAIKFENSSSVFAYRSDLASECLNINSPEEMTSATSKYSDYTELYKKLQNSNDSNCSDLSLFATSEYTNYILNPNNLIKDGQINDQIIEWLGWIKDNIDSNLVYSRYGNYHELIDDSGEIGFLGDVTTVNQLRDFYDFNQEGKWAIAQTPINYQGSTSYFLVSKDANLDAVKDFFETTYFNEGWLRDNINNLGIIENSNVMDESNYTELDLNSYFTNEDLQSELNTASHKVINNNDDVTSTYDYGIRNTMTGVVNDYINGTLKKNEVINRIEKDLAIFYS